MAIIVVLHVSFAVCAVEYILCYCKCEIYPITCDLLCSPLCDGALVCLCIAIDIDATDLDLEENELPVNLRSPKASPNTVMSPLAKEKRMPFFKKVNSGLPNPLFFFVRPHSSD